MVTGQLLWHSCQVIIKQYESICFIRVLLERGLACILLVYLHGWPQQDVSALIGGHLGTTRLPVVSHLYDYTATMEDVHLRQIAHGGCEPTDNFFTRSRHKHKTCLKLPSMLHNTWITNNQIMLKLNLHLIQCEPSKTYNVISASHLYMCTNTPAIFPTDPPE